MRFCQLDKIIHFEPGKQIRAVTTVKGDEDYLRDHFPRFEVMPGVLMLEALYQASSFLVRASEDYQTGLVLLRAAKNVKFGDFVQPGQSLEIESEIFKQEGPTYTMKAVGRKGDSVAVSGRLILECIPTDDESVNNYASAFMRQKTRQLQEAAMA